MDLFKKGNRNRRYLRMRKRRIRKADREDLLGRWAVAISTLFTVVIWIAVWLQK